MADDFDTLSFEKRLTSLKDTQENIQTLSSWCLMKRQYHKKIVASWLNVLKRVKVEQRLVLFYLANDVIQYSKRKNYEFVDSWGTTLQKATPLVRDDKIKHKILRIFRIWEERQIYNDEFLTDLTGLLSVTAGKQAADIDPNDFQAIQLVNKIRQCSVLEADTDQQLKQIHEFRLPLSDVNLLCTSLKDIKDPEETKQDVEESISRLQGYVSALQKELVARAALCRLLQKAHNHYATQRGEVKVVANAYKNFGNRVRGLKRKLDELYDELPLAATSPIPSPPSPGEPVPSPGPDEDLELPSSMISDISTGKGFSSFIGNADFSRSLREKHPDLSLKNEEVKKIEVISNRPDNSSEVTVDIHNLLKSLIPEKTLPETNSENSYGSLLTPPPPPPMVLPGLDLLHSSDAVDSVLSVCPPNPNFYGTINTTVENISGLNTITDSFIQENNPNTWNNTWESQRILATDTPESPPPPLSRSPPPPPPIIPVPPPVPDIDHRQLLLLPPILPPVDVDHRNLISLTMASIPPPPAPPLAPWTPQISCVDQDYRSTGEEFSTAIPPPPLPPMNIPPPSRRLTSHTDNVESIDMEMSDEEMHDSHDDGNYSRHIRIESSMARIHGHPPPLPHQNQTPSYRKQDLINRDKLFVNNNRLLVDIPQSELRNNVTHQNNVSLQRTNLVHINSSEDIEDNKQDEHQSDTINKENSRGKESNPVKDIFSDFPANAMNPINPNIGDSLSSQLSSVENKNDNEWEKSDEEFAGRDPWQKRANLINPTMPNIVRTRPVFNQRSQQMNFRRPPPLLSTPSFVDEHYFNPYNPRGSGNFRRPWGHHRPHRGGYW